MSLLYSNRPFVNHFQTSSIPLGQSKSNFMWCLRLNGEHSLYKCSRLHDQAVCHTNPLVVITCSSKKLRGHIGLGLAVCLCVRYACARARTVRDRILFGIWKVYED